MDRVFRCDDSSSFYIYLLKLFKENLEEKDLDFEILVVLLPHPLFTTPFVETDRVVLVEAIQTVLRWKKKEELIRNIVFTSFCTFGKVSTLNVERSWYSAFLTMTIGSLNNSDYGKD